jgi:ABC-2 type transport system permease protein
MQSPLLPSTWASNGVLAAANYDLSRAVFLFLLLAANALMALLVTGLLAEKLFYPGWSYLMGQDRQRFKPLDKGPLNKFVGYLSFVRNPARSLVIKDIKLFWRDPTQWSQFVIFFGIMAIYIANLRNTSSFREEEFWRSWIACLNVGALTLILATLTSRFVFPLISLEGRRFWILGLAPLSYKQLVWQKFWLSVTTSLTFTAGLAVLSGYMLQLEPVYWGLTVYSVIITNFGLSGLAVGLGTLYPTFTEDNPARIVSGMGGTLNLLLSVAYITLVVAAQVIVLQWEILDLFTTDTAFWYALSASVTFITALSTLCIFLPMRLGLRNLENMEF